MWQRIQTAYLAVVVISLALVTAGIKVVGFENASGDNYELELVVNVFGAQADATIDENISDEELEGLSNFLDLKKRTNRVQAFPVVSFPFYLISIFMLLLSLATVFTFKNLKTQQKLGRINFIVNFFALVFIIIIFYGLRSQFSNAIEPNEISTSLGLGFFCFIFATAFSFLANIGIKRDIKLIESIDRIR